ncbi:MAG TPA: hypothetical protein VGW57_05280 [Chthoniobacterales bacterium]|nr:hypothetical protein [Chthoniobacterales bacterium]
MYSSATTSSSASGFIGGALLTGEDFAEDFGDGEGEEEGAAGAAGEGDDFCLGERAGFSDGDGEVFCNGFTGPVGRSGGAGLAAGVGEGEGDGAAARVAAPKQSSSAKMNERDLIESRGAPTLDDALRVAKNFRMSDHRPRVETSFFL